MITALQWGTRQREHSKMEWMNDRTAASSMTQAGNTAKKGKPAKVAVQKQLKQAAEYS